VALILLAGLLLTGCAGAKAEQPTATPSALARELIGKWKITEGTLAKTGDSVAGQTMEFRSDGTFTWEKREGTYSVYQDVGVKMVSTYGEELSYDIELNGDTMRMTHGTNCGKLDDFKLERIK